MSDAFSPLLRNGARRDLNCAADRMTGAIREGGGVYDPFESHGLPLFFADSLDIAI